VPGGHAALPLANSKSHHSEVREDIEMTAQPVRKEENRNPRTSDEARSFVAYVESLFMPWNIDALVAGFTEDCVVRFGVIAEFRGRDALRKFFTARSVKQKGYRLRKQFRALMNDVMTNIWDGEWEDADTGRPMTGFGVEVWTMQGGKIAIWEASFNAAPADLEVDVNQALR
jgi:nuclear transport factor 2 (NTF2) superfamily protein